MTTTNTAVFTEQTLVSWYWRLGTLHGELLQQKKMDVIDRQKMGGLLLPIGPGLVLETARGISAQPHLFPDAPASGPDLEGRQQVAYGWLLLRDRLRLMARLADDAYLAAQAPLNGLVLPFVKKNLAQSIPPQIQGADIPRRNIALIPAMLMLHAYFKSNNKTRDGNQEIATQKEAVARQAAAISSGPAPAQAATVAVQGAALVPHPADLAAAPPPPSRPRKSAERLRVEAQQRAHDRAVLARVFEDFLRSRWRDPGVGDGQHAASPESDVGNSGRAASSESGKNNLPDPELREFGARWTSVT